MVSLPVVTSGFPAIVRDSRAGNQHESASMADHADTRLSDSERYFIAGRHSEGAPGNGMLAMRLPVKTTRCKLSGTQYDDKFNEGSSLLYLPLIALQGGPDMGPVR